MERATEGRARGMERIEGVREDGEGRRGVQTRGREEGKGRIVPGGISDDVPSSLPRSGSPIFR